MEPLQILDQIDQGLSALSSWLEPFWPYLLLLPLLMWAWFSGPALLRSIWDQILNHPFGDFWPVPAAILPVAIALTKGFDPEGPFGSAGPIVLSGLLIAVVFLQIYGQSRNNNYRDQQATRINSIGAGIESIGAENKQQATRINSIGAEIESIGALIVDLVVESRKNASRGGEEDGFSAAASETEQDEDKSTIPGITEGDERLGEAVAPRNPSPLEDEYAEYDWGDFINPLEIEQFYNDWLAFEFRKCDSSIELFNAVLDRINYIGKCFFLEALRISSWQASQYAYQFGAIEGSDYLIEMDITQEWISNWIGALLYDENAKRLLPEGSDIFGVVNDCLEFGVYQGAFHGLELRKGLEATARDGYPFRIPGRGGVGRI